MSDLRPDEPLFALRAAELSYRGHTALHPTTLEVRAGELLVIIGPNGAGKSTLLRLLTGETAPDRGEALSRGEPMRRLAPAALARRRAVLPQGSGLAFPFTVAEVVRLGLEAGGRRPDRALVADALRRVDLEGFAGRLYGELSGGEQQRVHLARVLAQVGDPVGPEGPRTLFLDEPVSSLDIRHQLGVLAIAQDFARGGGAAVAILHDLNLAAGFASRLVAISQGRIAASGPPGAVLTDALMREVFGVALRVRAVPAAPTPFVLPQAGGGAAGEPAAP